MRKIETKMNAAILNNENWQKDNTAVTYDPDTNNSKVFLHGHLIVVVGDDHVEIMDGGYQSKTTKSRLNAICTFNGIVSLENVFSRRIISGSFVSSLAQSMDKVYSKLKNFIPPISLLDPKMNTIT